VHSLLLHILLLLLLRLLLLLLLPLQLPPQPQTRRGKESRRMGGKKVDLRIR